VLLNEQFFFDDDKLIVKRTNDFTPVVNAVKQIRDFTTGGDTWHVGRIPSALIGMWIKEAGLSWWDTEATQDLIRKKLLSGEYSAFRPHEGSF